jgi:hypothetical protein
MQKTFVLAIVALTVLVAATTAVSAQEINREIQFEDNVTVGEETTITFISNIEESPAEVEADVGITLLVDGEEVDSTTVTKEITDGTQIRVNFTHTFESAGERQVRVETLTQALGTEVEGSVESSVMVSEAGMGNETDGTDADDGNETDETDAGMDDMNETDETEDNETEMTDNETDEGTGDGTESEGLPGFTAVVALISIAAAVAYREVRN